MRNGDAYKIKAMHKAGSTDKEIIAYMGRKYPESEVKKFIPKQVKQVKRGKDKKETETGSQPEA